MVSLKQIFAVLLAAGCVAAGGGCHKSATHTMEDFQAEARNAPPEQKEKALAALHGWLLASGYTRLATPADVQAATAWSGGVPFKEAWRKTLDPRVPRSLFVVTVMEVGELNVLDIRLTAESWVDAADGARENPMVEKEEREFCKVLDDFPWLLKPDPRTVPPFWTKP